MARERLVTRTLNITNGTGLFVDEQEKTVKEEEFIVGGHIDNDKKLIEKINSNKQGLICVTIIDKFFDEEVYTIPEDKFISIANKKEEK